jgi:hypothetical protein
VDLNNKLGNRVDKIIDPKNKTKMSILSHLEVYLLLWFIIYILIIFISPIALDPQCNLGWYKDPVLLFLILTAGFEILMMRELKNFIDNFRLLKLGLANIALTSYSTIMTKLDVYTDIKFVYEYSVCEREDTFKRNIGVISGFVMAINLGMLLWTSIS